MAFIVIGILLCLRVWFGVGEKRILQMTNNFLSVFTCCPVGFCMGLLIVCITKHQTVHFYAPTILQEHSDLLSFICVSVCVQLLLYQSMDFDQTRTHARPKCEIKSSHQDKFWLNCGPLFHVTMLFCGGIYGHRLSFLLNSLEILATTTTKNQLTAINNVYMNESGMK